MKRKQVVGVLNNIMKDLNPRMELTKGLHGGLVVPTMIYYGLRSLGSFGSIRNVRKPVNGKVLRSAFYTAAKRATFGGGSLPYCRLL